MVYLTSMVALFSAFLVLVALAWKPAKHFMGDVMEDANQSNYEDMRAHKIKLRAIVFEREQRANNKNKKRK